MARNARRVLIGAVGFAILFHLGGGWYFASRIEARALQLDHGAAEHDVVIVAIGPDQVSFQLLDMGSDADRYARGALESDERRVLIGPVIHETEDDQGQRVVTRQVLRVEGLAPAPGDTAHWDAWVFETPEQRGLVARETTFKGPVGELGAWLVDGADSSRWAVVVHGRAAERREALRIAPALAAAGLTVLVIDYRNDSGAPTDPSGHYRFGATEWEDADAAIDHAIEHGAEDVVLVGLSMGAAIAANTWAHDERDRIAALVLDSPILDLGSTIDLGAADTDLIPGTGMPIPGSLTATAKWIAGVRWNIDWSALRWQHWFDGLDVPVLLIHGEDDLTVPFETSLAFAKAHPDQVTWVPLPDVGHVRAWNADPSAYEELVTGWLSRR